VHDGEPAAGGLHEQFRLLVENLPVGVYIDRADADATNVYSNPRLIEMLGWTLDEWVGNADFYASILHPEDRDEVLAEVARCAETGDVFRMEYRLRRKDGGYTWVYDESRLVRDERGEPLYVLGAMIDITPRKTQEQRYRTLVESLPLFTYVDSPDGTTLYVSPQIEEMLGYPAEEWLRRDRDLFPEVLHPDDRETVLSTRGGPPPDRRSQQFRVVARDGRVLWVHSERVAVRDAAGAPVFVQGFWVDLTERRRLEEELRQAQRLEAIGQLAGGIAHDFNNLLTAISGFTAFALDGLDSGNVEGARADVAEIGRAADRATTLTQQLLAFSRGQQGLAESVDLNALVLEMGAMFGRLIGEHIEVTLDLEESLPEVEVDPGHIQQVVANLIINARDAMPSGGRLTVSTRLVPHEGEQHVELAVSDTGHGMDEETRDRIFEPFFTTKPVGEGTGLGLSSVYGIVRQAGGGVVVETEPGAGSTFRVLLPPRNGAASRVAPAERSAADGSETILVVEDEAPVRQVLRRTLERYGYDVLEAGTPELALELAETTPFDAVVSDVVMPGLNGAELVRRLRRDRPELAVVYVSGFADSVVDADALDSRTVLLPKPFDEELLVGAVRRLLDGR
jgi:PAS domain S-box-containing protein